jgi:hypothetical protein
MFLNDIDHCDDDCFVHGDPESDFATDWPEAELRSARIVRLLPLLAANDFLEQDGTLPPVA